MQATTQRRCFFFIKMSNSIFKDRTHDRTLMWFLHPTSTDNMNTTDIYIQTTSINQSKRVRHRTLKPPFKMRENPPIIIICEKH